MLGIFSLTLTKKKHGNLAFFWGEKYSVSHTVYDYEGLIFKLATRWERAPFSHTGGYWLKTIKCKTSCIPYTVLNPGSSHSVACIQVARSVYNKWVQSINQSLKVVPVLIALYRKREGVLRA